jgi:hypothetical protein
MVDGFGDMHELSFHVLGTETMQRRFMVKFSGPWREKQIVKQFGLTVLNSWERFQVKFWAGKSKRAIEHLKIREIRKQRVCNPQAHKTKPCAHTCWAQQNSKRALSLSPNSC